MNDCVLITASEITIIEVSLNIKLRSTEIDDLEFVLQIEHAKENKAFIAQWTKNQHQAILESEINHHLIIENANKEKLGYIILYNLTAINQGYYIKRIALSEKSKGIGRKALRLLIKNMQLSHLKLAVVESNIRAIKSYRAAGFEIKSLSTEERKAFKINIDDISEDCLVMEYRNGPNQ